MKPLIAIVGATGIGKSRLAMALAVRFQGEVIGADSRQLYRRFDIGTAKPTPDEQARVRHHCIDVVDADEDFGLAQYQELAYAAIDDVHRRGRLPILVGGSGLYVWAVLEGWRIPRVPPDPQLRRELEGQATDDGGERLYRQLVETDPVAAGRIDRRNVRRVIRALEVSRAAGAPSSGLQGKQPPDYATLIVGLTATRAETYRRTDARVEAMVSAGLVDEVRGLVATFGDEHPAMSGIGYRQIAAYLRGEMSLAEAMERTRVETHRLVRHQGGWFRLKDDRIHWFDVGQGDVAIADEVARFLEAGGDVGVSPG